MINHNMKNSIYNLAFPYKNMFLVANTLSGGISILSATEYNALCSNTYTTDLLRSFRKQGFIVPNETNELEIVNKTRIAA